MQRVLQDDNAASLTFRQRKESRREAWARVLAPKAAAAFSAKKSVFSTEEEEERYLRQGLRDLGLPDNVIDRAVSDDPQTLLEDQHREKNETIPPGLGLVFKTVSKRDPEFASPSMLAAIATEMGKLERAGTWEMSPYRMSHAKRVQGAHHVRLHCIRGVKSSESSPTAKARLVCLGNAVRDNQGLLTAFEEASSCPTTMATIRAIAAFSAAEGSIPQTADAIAAYVQAKLDPSICIFATMDSALFTPQMKEQVKKLGTTEPIC